MRDAIARLVSRDAPNDALGTAFAISPEFGLTAFHCVGDREAGRVTERFTRLLFLGGGIVDAEYLDGDPRADFAVLRFLAQLPTDLRTIPLAVKLTPNEPYRCVGYPRGIHGPDVTASTGTVAAPEASIFQGVPAIQLYSKESAAGLSLAGMSGAPVLVDAPEEAAVGIIRWNPPRELGSPLAVGGMVYACPVRSVIERRGELAQYVIERLPAISDVLDRLPTLFDATLAQRLEQHERDYEASYLDRVKKKYERVETLGVRDLKEFRQPLTLAYVSLSVKSTEAGGEGGRRQAEDVLEQEPLLTVRAPAGAGKTTLLNWIALACAQGADIETNHRWRGGVPFVVPLRAIKVKDKGSPDLGQLVDYTIDLKQWPNPPPSRWILKILNAKRGVIMLDGVDELPPSVRSSFWSWVKNDLMEQYPGNRIIVTSRYLPKSRTDDWQPPSGFASADLDEMTNDDVNQFVSRWHQGALDAEPDASVRAKLEVARDTLPIKLADPVNHRVRELCATPLLCSMICALHWREEGYLPSQRIELYERCVDMLVEERDLKRGIEKPSEPLCWIGKDDKEMLLQQLAYTMMKEAISSEESRSRIEVPKQQAERWIAGWLHSFQDERARKSKPAEVLEYLIERSGLVREPVSETIEYTHRSFQEYLAACGAGARDVPGELANQAPDDQWHEIIILAAGTKTGGIPFGRRLIDALVTRGERKRFALLSRSHRNERDAYFALAVACLETAKQAGPDLEQRVLSHLKDLVPPQNASAAKNISAAGRAALPFLMYDKWKDQGEETVAACARAVRLINGDEGNKMLVEGYGNDTRESVLEEIARSTSVDVLSLPAVRQLLLRGERLPGGLGPVVRDLRALVSGVNANFSSTGVAPLAAIEPLSLTKLNLAGLRRITNLSPLAAFLNLESLDLSNCAGIYDLSPLAALLKLESLDLSLCGAIHNLTPLRSLIKLRELKLSSCRLITDLRPLEALQENLRSLDLSRCDGVDDLNPVATLKGLRVLTLSQSRFPNMAFSSFPLFAPGLIAPGLITSGLIKQLIRNALPRTMVAIHQMRSPQSLDLEPIFRLKGLEVLRLIGFNLQDLRPLAALDRLLSLNMWGSLWLVDLTPLQSLKNLRTLNLAGCQNLSDLSALKSLTRLQGLSLVGCNSIVDFNPLAGLESLQQIYVDRKMLNRLPPNLKPKAVLPSYPNFLGISASREALDMWWAQSAF